MIFVHRPLNWLLAVFCLLTVALVTVACASPAAEQVSAPEVSAPEVTDAPAAVLAPATAMAATATEPAAAPVAAEKIATPAAAPVESTAPVSVAPATDTPMPASDASAFAFSLGEGTEARFKVEEVLARTGFKVATGITDEVSGLIVFDPDGGVADESRIVVQAGTLSTDSNRRDGYVRDRTLGTDTYPEVVFEPTAVSGLPVPLIDAAGSHEFTITGDLTIKDQTREVTWNAMAEFGEDGAVSGLASVEFTFDDFGMTKPSVAVVLSVEDTIRLEIDFVGTMAAR